MNKIILALDPGTDKTGWCLFDGRYLDGGILENSEMLERLGSRDYAMPFGAGHLAIEMIASYGMAVGREVFETCVWIGRYWEAWRAVSFGDDPMLVYRKDVKLALCGTPRANDANVRCEIQDRLGKVGTKKEPGPLFGVKSHVWPALGVAIVANQKLEDQCKS